MTFDQILDQARSNAGKIQSLGQKIGKDVSSYFPKELKALNDCLDTYSASKVMIATTIADFSGSLSLEGAATLFSNFDNNWDKFAAEYTSIFSRLDPSIKENVLETFARSHFGDTVFEAGSIIKNETASILSGIVLFRGGVNSFKGSFRNPQVAASKIKNGVAAIVNSTAQIANSVNNILKFIQGRNTKNPAGSVVLGKLAGLPQMRSVATSLSVLTGAESALSGFSQAQGAISSLKQGDIQSAAIQGVNAVKQIKNATKAVESAIKGNPYTTSVQNSQITSLGSNANGAGGGAQGVQQNASDSDSDLGGTDSYVCSTARIKCTCGDKISTLTVLPSRTVWLTGEPQANISDHQSMVNIAPFGKCHTTAYPPTGSATAANHGKLTPMPCVPNTPYAWMNGKNDVIIKGDPALLKSSSCKCVWGGTITITDDGQKITSGIINGQMVAKQAMMDFTCNIKKITFSYPDNDNQTCQKTIYNYDSQSGYSTLKEYVPDLEDSDTSEGPLLKGGVVAYSERRYYFISNYKGKEVKLDCERVAHCCTDSAHSSVDIESVDVDNRSIVKSRQPHAELSLNLRYYDLFWRAKDYSQTALCSSLASSATMQVAPAVATGAYAVGSIMDFIHAFRFFLLPTIDESDEEYYCYTLLEYHECVHSEGVKPIRILIYPDIEYKFEIGLKKKREYKGNEEDDDSSFKGCSVKLSATYNSVEKEFSLEYGDKQEIASNSQDKKSTLFYKTLCMLAKAFECMQGFTNEFADTLEETYGKNNSLTSDARVLQKGTDKLPRKFNWLSGSLEFQPQLALNWKYHVSEDLTELKRSIDVDLVLKGEGLIKVDLVELSRTILKKTKTVTTAGVVVVSAGSGGLAALPAILVKALVDFIVTAFANMLSEPFKAELSIGAKATVRRLKFNTLEKAVSANLEIVPKIKLYLAIEAKAPFIIQTLTDGKTEKKTEKKSEGKFGLKVYAESQASFTISLNVNASTDKIEIEQTAEINPFKIAIGLEVVGDWKCFKDDNEDDNEDNGKLQDFKGKFQKEWKFGGCKLQPHKFTLFDNNA